MSEAPVPRGFGPVILRTHDLPAAEQVEAWRGWFDPIFDLEHTSAESEGFLAESLAWPLAGMGLSRVTAPRLRVMRTPQLLRRNPLDHWSLTMGGVETRLLTPGGPVLIPAGVPFIVSLGQEVVSERVADQRLQLYLSRDRLDGLAALLDAACGVPLQGVMGQLLADYLRLLASRIPLLQPEEAARLPDAIAAMVGACVQPNAERLAQAESQLEATRLARVRRAIRAHLGSARLSPQLLCRLAGTSRSQLYRLLEGEGGVARYIQKLRLEASHAALGDARDGRSIAQVAEACGFHDPSAFSRAFRREFGATPSEVRIAALAGRAIRPNTTGTPPTPTLSDWLRGF